MIKVLRKGCILLLASFLLIGCGKRNVNPNSNVDNHVEKQTPTPEEEEVEKEEELSKKENSSGDEVKKEYIFEKKEPIQLSLDDYDSSLMEKANGWTNGQMFDCTWRGDNVTFSDGIMKLIIDSDGENASPKWSGGEYRTKGFYHYGLYEVSMKPIKNDGVVSSFFTYTGPSDSNPWDEIDIEFLGKDTTKIQFNYFTNGVGNHEHMYELGFDASEEFHTYGFEWLPDSITWYVDEEVVHTATANIPITPSKLMMNAWPGVGVDGWLKPFDGNVPVQAEYDWIRITEYNAVEVE